MEEDQKNTEKQKKATAKSRRRPAEKLWEKDFLDLANFHITFGFKVTDSGEKHLQTRVIHYEDEKNEVWENIVREPLIDWILRQASEALPPEAQFQSTSKDEKVREIPAPAPAQSIIEIADLQVNESRAAAFGTNRPAQPRLQMECSMVVNDTMGQLTAKQLPYIIDFFLVDISTDEAIIVATEEGQLKPGQDTYPVRQSFAAPPLGRYQMYAAARILPPGQATAYARGPVIKMEI